MWGQAPSITFPVNEVRIIPTRVGTSRQLPFITINGKDHPHACGDKVSVPTVFFAERGSSPRVWGQGLKLLPFSVAKRIIPTRVGTRKTTHADTRTDEDHPHACGDKQCSAFNLLR